MSLTQLRSLTQRITLTHIIIHSLITIRLEYYEILNSRFALEHRYTRDKILSLVPDTTWFKCKIIKVHPGGLYDVHFDNGDNEEKVPAKMIRKHGEPKPVPKQTFKKGEKVEKQKNLRAARVLARVLKTWKPRIMSGWFMKVNRRGKQQKRWFHLLGT